MSMKLLIAVPTTDYVHAQFMDCLIKLVEEIHRRRIACTVEISAGTLVYIARNRIACKAINEGYTHVLWLDSDMVFSPKILEDLEECEKAMVCGAFVSRRPPYSPCIYKTLKPGQVEKVREFGLEPFRVAGCGFACVLTAVEVLRDVQMKYGTCFMPTVDYGEDLAFCDRVNSIGREIWCEPTARVGHIAHVPVWPGEEPSI